jgi:hypothetical protein
MSSGSNGTSPCKSKVEGKVVDSKPTGYGCDLPVNIKKFLIVAIDFLLKIEFLLSLQIDWGSCLMVLLHKYSL